MNSKTKLITYSALMCALIIISTLWLKFSIPGTDVLVTTQVFFIILCGQILPWKYCVYTVGIYLFLGLFGLPVFSAVSGPAVIATPSFGYLLAFPFAAATVSLTREKLPKQKSSRYIASSVGIVVNYIIALAYIAALKGLYLDAPVSMGVLLSAYCFAFLPMDVIKGILAAMLGQRLEKPLHLQGIEA